MATFIVCPAREGRLLKQIPDCSGKKHFLALSQAGQDAIEINGLWISPKASKKTGLMNLLIWLTVISKILLQRESYLLISRNTHNKVIARYHSLLNPILIYEGEAMSVSNSVTHKSCTFMYAKKWQIILAPLRGWRLIIRRLVLVYKITFRNRTF